MDNLKKYIICTDSLQKRDLWVKDLKSLIDQKLFQNNPKNIVNSNSTNTVPEKLIPDSSSKQLFYTPPMALVSTQNMEIEKLKGQNSKSLFEANVYLPCPQIQLQGWEQWDVVKKLGGHFIRDNSFQDISNIKKIEKSHLFLFQNFLLITKPKETKDTSIGQFVYQTHAATGNYLISETQNHSISSSKLTFS